MSRNKIRKTLNKWHGRLGLLASLFVLLLSITGVLINHAHNLKLDKSSVSQAWILNLYHLEAPKIKASAVRNAWIVWQNNELYYNDQQLSQCGGDFRGAIALENHWIAACEFDLLIFSYEQELLERISQYINLQYPIDMLGNCGGSLCYQSMEKIYQVDMDSLENKKVNASLAKPIWSKIELPPSKVLRDVQSQFVGDITWERVILDIHAGRFLGKIGPYFMDFIALLFIVLATSGLWVWAKRGKRKTKTK